MSDTPIFVYGTLRPIIADEGRIEALDKDRYGR